jgi:hypothetical protein
METIYRTQLHAKDLKTLANVAKAVNEEVTLGLDAEAEKEGQRFRFWSKDEQKKCALVGTLIVEYEDTEGAVNVRLPTSNLYDTLATFGAKDMVDVTIVEDKANEDQPLSLNFTNLRTGETRSMTVQEAEEEDQPYAGKVGKGGPMCNVPAKELHKVVAAYKKYANVVEVQIDGGLQVRYRSRNAEDSWRHVTEESTGTGTAKFSTNLLAAAATACKNAGKAVNITLSPTAMRLNVGSETIGCRIYVVASTSI